jgi:hypothetical protein
MRKTIIGIIILVLSARTINSLAISFEVIIEGGEVKVQGTSSIHDWLINLKHLNCAVEFINEGSDIINIGKVTFSCRAKDLQSEYDLMDKKTYDALQADQFPVITFHSNSTTALISDGEKFRGDLTGQLSIAGETRKITIPFTGIILSDNIIEVNGKAELRMSDFNIDPPTAMMGALKTGDNISVSFKMRFKQKVH